MSVLFLDTSALVKSYLMEKGSLWMMSQCDPGAKNAIVISQITLIEAVATFCRRARETGSDQKITLKKRDRLVKLFREHVDKRYQIIEVIEPLYTQASNLCFTHPLRAYDALQLICAQAAREQFLSRGLPAPIFVSADNKLLEIAMAEGFSVDNPNNYS